MFQSFLGRFAPNISWAIYPKYFLRDLFQALLVFHTGECHQNIVKVGKVILWNYSIVRPAPPISAMHCSYLQHYQLVDEKELAPLKELIDSMMGKANGVMRSIA